MKFALIALLALTSSCGSPVLPDVSPAPDESPTVPRQAPKLPTEETFPTFEPFESTITLPSELATELQELETEIQRELERFRAAAAQGERVPDPWMSSGAGVLPSSMTVEQRMVAMWVPAMLQELATQWRSDLWGVEEVERATAVTSFLRRLPDVPQPQFTLESHEQNRAGLEALASWFRRKVETPDWYAAMLQRHSIDYGPFVGLPCDTTDALNERGTWPVDERMEFRLYHIERETNPWVFQIVRDGVPLWTRVAPSYWYNNVRFLDYSPATVANLGTYGWRVSLAWDGETCAIYLDEAGQLLFFFVGFN